MDGDVVGHYHFIDDESGHDEPNHEPAERAHQSCADWQSTGECREEKEVESDLIGDVLPGDQRVFPLALHYDEGEHREADQRKKVGTDHGQLSHEQDDGGVDDAAEKKDERVQEGGTVGVIPLKSVEERAVALAWPDQRFEFDTEACLDRHQGLQSEHVYLLRSNFLD